MAGTLKRVLRIRAAQEAMARTEFEAETAQLRELERGAVEAGREARESRERWFALVCDASPELADRSEEEKERDGAPLADRRMVGESPVEEEPVGERLGAEAPMVEDPAADWSVADRSPADRLTAERWTEPAAAERASVGRRIEEGAWDAAVWTGEQADLRRPAHQAAVERAWVEFLASRRQRVQMESLIAGAAAVQRREDDRREQRRLDDWYQALPRQPAEELRAQGGDEDGSGIERASWRAEPAREDLARTDMAGADMAGAGLSGAELVGADLASTDLAAGPCGRGKTPMVGTDSFVAPPKF